MYWLCIADRTGLTFGATVVSNGRCTVTGHEFEHCDSSNSSTIEKYS